MREKETGGPAFPLPDFAEFGMDLHDYFAAKAMQGLLADGNVMAPVNEFAAKSYQMADAMLEARK